MLYVMDWVYGGCCMVAGNDRNDTSAGDGRGGRRGSTELDTITD